MSLRLLSGRRQARTGRSTFYKPSSGCCLSEELEQWGALYGDAFVHGCEEGECFRRTLQRLVSSEKVVRALSDGAIEKSALPGSATFSLVMKINSVLAHQL